jgi:predicted transcriptional regulator YdeE
MKHTTLFATSFLSMTLLSSAQEQPQENTVDKTAEKAAEPALKVIQMQHEEFLFLCREYPNRDHGNIWDHFLGNGAYEKINPHQVKPTEHTIVIHNNNPEDLMYCPGKMVEGVAEAPEGFSLIKFPAREFLICTHEWLPTDGETRWQIGRAGDLARTVEIPEGYVRHDGPGSQIVLMEYVRHEPENGHRWEFWVPIRKITPEEAIPVPLILTEDE